MAEFETKRTYNRKVAKNKSVIAFVTIDEMLAAGLSPTYRVPVKRTWLNEMMPKSEDEVEDEIDNDGEDEDENDVPASNGVVIIPREHV